MFARHLKIFSVKLEGPKRRGLLRKNTMRAPQQHNGFYERANEGVMLRTTEGIIKFWNRSAENLYGWGREDAIGRVSHELLNTQFPKPLPDIESELVEKGRWEGKLVHVTRAGGQVVVESQWTLQRNGQQETVVEINAPAEDRNRDTGARESTLAAPQNRMPRPALAKPSFYLPRWLLEKIPVAAALFIPLAWVLYFFFGRLLINAIYSTDLYGIADRIMAGRVSTPVENYYYRADQLFWSGTLVILIAAFACWLVIRNLRGTLLAAFSALTFSFLLFGVLEIFPPLIRMLHVDALSPYFAIRASFVYDDQLVFREKPFNRGFVGQFRGANYSPVYGIEVSPSTVDWETDRNGFRNSGGTDSTDVVVLGDSYMEYGRNESETFAGRLRERLPGLTVMNLGKSGYGPIQYVEVLKRFGLSYAPRYALFAFYEGNDFIDIRNYRLWKAGQLRGGEPTYFIHQQNLFGRYSMAVQTTVQQFSEAGLAWVHLMMDGNPLLGEEADKIHPDVALLELGNGKLEKMLIDDSFTRLHEAISERENWAVLESLIREFKDLCAAQQITPIFVYIPSPSHIYAQFSTDRSGASWLAIREREVAAKEGTEKAVSRLVQSAGVDFVTLTPILEQEAKKGKLLYLNVDPHWNAAGTEVAAGDIADYLKRNHLR
jgi:PAS domain S-box-containing protein